MKNYVLTCSSTCDLSPYFLRQHNIYYVSFFYYLNGNKYYDDFFKEHSIDDFYKTIKTSDVKTSQPDPNQYKDLWLKLIEQGNDILHIELSSGISGAVNSALIAKSMVEDINPLAKIYVIDSLCCSTGYGLLLKYASDQKNIGKSIDELYNILNEKKFNINHIFATTSLDQFIKGGRLNKMAGSVGKLLNIIPVLHVDENGKLAIIKKVRGKSNAFDEIINTVLSNICDKEEYSDYFFFNHSNDLEDIDVLYNKLNVKFKKAKFSTENIYNVGTVIGAHTGIGTISVFYFGDGRA